jgi:hypothetical protein
VKRTVLALIAAASFGFASPVQAHTRGPALACAVRAWSGYNSTGSEFDDWVRGSWEGIPFAAHSYGTTNCGAVFPDGRYRAPWTGGNLLASWSVYQY